MARAMVILVSYKPEKVLYLSVYNVSTEEVAFSSCFETNLFRDIKEAQAYAEELDSHTDMDDYDWRHRYYVGEEYNIFPNLTKEKGSDHLKQVIEEWENDGVRHAFETMRVKTVEKSKGLRDEEFGVLGL